MNTNAPTLTREGYFTVPPLKRLQRMSDDELAAVERFVVREKPPCPSLNTKQRQTETWSPVRCKFGSPAAVRLLARQRLSCCDQYSKPAAA